MKFGKVNFQLTVREEVFDNSLQTFTIFNIKAVIQY